MIVREFKKRLSSCRMLASLAALVLAGAGLWYGVLFALAGRSGMALRDLMGEREALQGVTVEGAVQDNSFQIDFTVTEAGVQNRFNPRYAVETDAGSRSYYESAIVQPAPGADTSAPQQAIDENREPYYMITTDELAYYICVWGAAGRELAVFDSGLRCAAPEGGRFFLYSHNLNMDGSGPRIWYLAAPGQNAGEADQAAYARTQEFSWHSWRTRAGQQEFFAITAGDETQVFRIDEWGSSREIAANTVAEIGAEFVDYSRPIGAVSLAASLPGELKGAAPAGTDSAVLVLRRPGALIAIALDETGALTDETPLLELGEGQEFYEIHFCSPAKTTHADLGLVLYTDDGDDPDGPDGPPWKGSWAAALRIENGRFTTAQTLCLAEAGGIAQFLGAGLSEDGTRLVTVQQRLPGAAGQPPAGLWEDGQYLAGEVSVAVWQDGRQLYEGILAGDWREDTQLDFEVGRVWRRSCRFGKADPYGSEALTAGAYFWSKEEVALQ